MNGARLLRWVAVPVLACGGCASPAPTGRSHTLLREAAVTPAAAFAAARQAVGERFRIRLSDPAAGLVRSEPVMAEAPPAPGRIDTTLGKPRLVRKTVEVRIEPEGDAVTIGCKVIVEENQAGAHRVFAEEHAISDVPSETPADRGAASTPEQEAVWRVTGRDRELERQLCRAISELLARGGESP